MIRMYSKYERRTDTRTYDDRKKLYEGGWEVIRAESLDAIWKEKYEEWSKRPAKKLPKWFGERPGKKAGDAETLRVRKMVVRKHLQKKKITMKRKKRRRKKKRKRRSKSYALNKSTFDLPNISGSLFFYRRTGFFLLLRSGFFKLP